jgi:hypothetical protein
MSHVYVTGGRQRKTAANTEEEWTLYERALIVRLDTETDRSEPAVDYVSPPDACADSRPAFLFKSGSLRGGRLYVCTSTEVLIYEVPGFRRVGYISLPCFNDLHHVCPSRDGTLLVVSTGLDMVVEVSPDGRALRQWSVLGEDPWRRFSPDVDYRKVPTTKPHKSHPNFVFELGDDVWATRAVQGDAVCLTRPGLRIGLGKELVHDGHFHGGKIYFTTVDGTLVIVGQDSLRVEQVVDLKAIDNGEKALLGWCRGVMVLDERRVWVAFTRVRKTRFKEHINWVKHVFREVDKPTHMTLYDIEARKVLNEINLEAHGLNVVFSMIPAVGPRILDHARPQNGHGPAYAGGERDAVDVRGPRG